MKTRGFEIVSKYQGRGIDLPQRKTAASAGYDLQAARTVVVEPGQLAMVPTGRETNKDIGQLLLSIQKAFDVLVEKSTDLPISTIRDDTRSPASLRWRQVYR